jgi:hypothetical protein
LEAKPTVVTDAGYANSEHLQSLTDAGQTAYMAKLEKDNNQGDGKFYRLTAFTYDRERECYICVANQLLSRKQVMGTENCVVYVAQAKSCGAWALKPQCRGASQCIVRRLNGMAAVDDNARRVAAHPEMMKLRRRTVEHPFGTIKYEILRNTHLLMRGLKGAKGELSLAGPRL